MKYALIEEGAVVNLISLHQTNESDFPNAVSCEGFPVQIGDTHDGTNFYRNGERLKTRREMIVEELSALKASN